MSDFADLVSAALDTHDALDAGRRVHRVVHDELLQLDPAAEPVATGYFNHSYVPDFLVRWKEGTKTIERPVYLRHSLRSSRASGDLENLAKADRTTLFLSLSREEPADEANLARTALSENRQSRALITTVPAIDELARPVDVPDPVLGVVKASVVRSARGVFVEDDVEKLVLPRDRRIEASDFEAFAAVVSQNFTEEAVHRINRVVGIVEQALSQADAPQIPASGLLSATEIRELVPYLLRLEGVTQDRKFWLGLARLISLQEIERQWINFTDLDLTPLAAAGSSVWRATRAQLTMRSEAIDDEAFDRTPRWSVAGRTLSAEIGNWRIAFAFAGTKLKTSGRDALPARWNDLAPALEDYTVTDVDLSGLVTQSSYGAVEIADMKARIDNFIAGADDSFHVPAVTVTTGVDEDISVIRADFQEMMLQARPDASVGNLARVALDVLGYRYPVAPSDADALFQGLSAAGDPVNE